MPATPFTPLLEAEVTRQENQLSLIASENYCSRAVRDTLSSVLTNKYAEGYPGKRYYAGNAVADAVEKEAVAQAQATFQTDYHVNMQPHSGSPANLAAYLAVLEPGDTILAMRLDQGGHLTHGHNVSLTGKLFHFVHYGVSSETELIDYDAVAALAREQKPKLIVCGATAYPALLDFAAFARIATEVGALLLVDMAHVAGLVVGGAYPSPFGIADIITTTTHKTLRGPRAAAIFCRAALAKAVDRSVFPGLQGGPHLNTIAAAGVALWEAQQPAFKVYATQTVQNAKALAYRLQQHGIRLVTDGTDSHLILIDLRSVGMLGRAAQDRLEEVGIITNRNAIPFDPQPPTDPSGLRLGTAAITTRGFKEGDAELLADCIAQLLLDRSTAPSVSETVNRLAKKFRVPSV